MIINSLIQSLLFFLFLPLLSKIYVICFQDSLSFTLNHTNWQVFKIKGTGIGIERSV